MNNKDDLRILDYTSEVTFPYIKGLLIVNPPSVIDSRLQKLLKYSFPNNLRRFHIGWSHNKSLTHDYIDTLSCIISRTTDKVKLYWPRMDYSEFSRIVIASKHTHTLIFSCLRLRKRGTINFGNDIDYNIKKFGLQWSGHRLYSDWRYDKSQLFYIVEEMKKSNIHNKLEFFNVIHSKINVFMCLDAITMALNSS